jgi:hypothetical protein
LLPFFPRGRHHLNADGSVTAASGSGLLVVTGGVNFDGDFTRNGEMLVIGDRSFNVNGGGHGNINGGVFIAKTGNITSTGLTPLSSLGMPMFNWNGGTAGMQWDSCWANSVNTNNASAFKIISFRELM